MERAIFRSSTLWALIPVVSAAVVYFPLTQNYFWADDFFSLYRIRNGPLAEYIFMPLGGHLLVTTFGIFYLSYLAFGTRPEPYFVCVLLLHLVNVALLFAVARRVTRSDRAACFAALLWGTSPRLEGSLGWYSVFGHVIVGTALLCLLYELTTVEQTGAASWRRRVGWLALLLIAATSFGTGIGVVLMLPAVAFLVIPPTPIRARLTASLLGCAVGVLALYVALHRVTLPNYDAFNLVSRASGTVGQYFFVVLADLLRYGISTSMLGALWPRPRLEAPLTWVMLGIYIIVLLVPLLGGSARSRRYTLACLLLMLGCYALIAVGRQNFYPSNPGLAGSDRYYYVGALVTVLALCIAVAEAARHIRDRGLAAFDDRPVGRRLDAIATAVLVAWASALMAVRLAYGPAINHHDAARRETAAVVQQVRQAVAAAPPGADVYIENRPFRAMGPIFVHAAAFPGFAGVFVIFFPDNVVDGRRVYFVEPEQRYFAPANGGRRSATLLVASAPITHEPTVR